MFYYFLFVCTAYVLGSIPSGLIVGKVFYQTDIRQFGSKNLGGTNAFRVLGKKAGLIVTVSDILKGTLSILLPVLLSPVEVNLLFIGLFSVIGHMFPLFAQFKGGKAVATSAGLILGLSPVLFLISLVGFFVVLYITKFVSLSSIITCFIAVFTALMMQQYDLLILLLVLLLIIIYRHIPNIRRIRDKTEPKITWL